MSPATLLRSEARADAGGYVRVCDPCCRQKACEHPESMLPLTVKGEEATFVVMWMTADSQLRNKVTEGFCNNPTSYCPSKKVTA